MSRYLVCKIGWVASGGNRLPGPDRRRHFRVEGVWDVHVAAVEETGAVSEFDATALDISMGGVLLETAVKGNLWVGKAMAITFPSAGSPVPAVVRRFLEYGDEGRTTTRWGVEFTGLTLEVKATWTRFLYSEARRLGQEAAHREFLARRPT
jgi:c-di-GMP-binding flagellar brake protein YcgR